MRILLLLLILSINLTAFAQNWVGLEMGSRSVGFQCIQSYDLSRPPFKEQFQDTSTPDGRICPIYLWYPTQAESAQKMRLSDYLLLGGTVWSYQVDTIQQLQRARQFFFRYSHSDPVYFDSLLSLNLKMHAIRDAKVAKGIFPVILIVHQEVANIAAMAEFLASHGYCVVSFPMLGSFEVDFDFRQTSGIESEVRDMEYVLSLLKPMKFADTKQIGLIGLSFGAISCTAYALRNPAVKAVISLDGGIAESWGAGQLAKMPYFSVENIDFPILHLFSPVDAWNHSPQWMASYKYSKRYLVALPQLRHNDFSTYGLLSQFFPKWIDGELGQPLGDYKTGFQLVCHYTWLFLDMILKKERIREEDFINTNFDKKLPDNFLKVSIIPALSPRFTSAEMLQIYLNEGIDMLINQLKEKAVTDQTPASVTELFNTCNQLLREQRSEDALILSRYFEHLYPNSVQALFEIARSLEQLGRVEKAKAQYQNAFKNIETDPHLDRHWKDLFRSLLPQRF